MAKDTRKASVANLQKYSYQKFQNIRFLKNIYLGVNNYSSSCVCPSAKCNFGHSTEWLEYNWIPLISFGFKNCLYSNFQHIKTEKDGHCFAVPSLLCCMLHVQNFSPYPPGPSMVIIEHIISSYWNSDAIHFGSPEWPQLGQVYHLPNQYLPSIWFQSL